MRKFLLVSPFVIVIVLALAAVAALLARGMTVSFVWRPQSLPEMELRRPGGKIDYPDGSRWTHVWTLSRGWEREVELPHRLDFLRWRNSRTSLDFSRRAGRDSILDSR
jgi:hypothetical protein